MLGSILEKCAALPLVLAVSVPMTFGTVPAVSAEITAESNANTRMNYAGRQRMLTQQLARNACLVMAGVEPERFAAKADVNVQQFDSVLIGLREGEARLGMLPETDPAILAALTEVEALWARLGPAARQIAAGDVHSVPMAQLITLNMSTLTHMHQAVLTMAKTYQSPDISAALLKTVAVAGRQRMLTQKVSKEVCFKMIGLENLGARELVEATVQDFDTAMAMLLSGSEEAGILPPPNPAVRQQLERARGAWQDFKDLVTQIEDDPNVDHDTRVKLANMSDHVLKEMHRAVTLYVQ